MAPKLSRLLASEVLDVVAGLDDKKFRIHAELLASPSDTLWNQVSNKLCYPDDRKIVIHGHDGATVGRFAEFLYTGDYEAPGPVRISDAPGKGYTVDTLSSPPKEGFDQDTETQKWETKAQSLGEINDNSTNSELEACKPSDPPLLDMPPGYDVLGCLAPDPAANNPSIAIQSTLTPEDTLETSGQQELPEMLPDKAAHLDPSEFDFKDAFLAHGKTCSLAHSFDIEPLEMLAIARLEDAFRKITAVTPGSQVVSNFAALVEYAYEKPTGERLREAILKFFSPNVSVLRGVELQRLVSRGGDLASDLMKIVCDKLEDSEQENGQLFIDVKTLNDRLNLAEKSQDHAEAGVGLGGTLEGERTPPHQDVLGQGKDLTATQQRLMEELEKVENKRIQLEDCITKYSAHEKVIQALVMHKESLTSKNAAIQQDLGETREKLARCERKLRKLESEIYVEF